MKAKIIAVAGHKGGVGKAATHDVRAKFSPNTAESLPDEYV